MAESDDEEHSVGNKLAETLIAQSLDLPPKAAKVQPQSSVVQELHIEVPHCMPLNGCHGLQWRQHQRAKSERPRLMVQAPEAAWQSFDEDDESLTSTLRSLMKGEKHEFDIRARTSAILERDRGDTFDLSDDE